MSVHRQSRMIDSPGLLHMVKKANLGPRFDQTSMLHEQRATIPPPHPQCQAHNQVEFESSFGRFRSIFWRFQPKRREIGSFVRVARVPGRAGSQVTNLAIKEALLSKCCVKAISTSLFQDFGRGHPMILETTTCWRVKGIPNMFYFFGPRVPRLVQCDLNIQGRSNIHCFPEFSARLLKGWGFQLLGTKSISKFCIFLQSLRILNTIK